MSTCKLQREHLQASEGGAVIIPGLPNDLALRILAILPRILQARLRLVCRSWNDAMEPLSLNTLRKSLGIFEVWPFFTDEFTQVFAVVMSSVPHYIFEVCPFNEDPFATYPPKLQVLGIAPPPQLQQYPGLFEFWVFSVIGSRVLLTAEPCHESVDHLQGIYVFDASSMRWTDCVYPNGYYDPNFCFKTPVDAQGGYVYVASGSKWHFDRLDYKSGKWEALPSPHTEREFAAVVVLHGCLYVLGGLNYNVPGHGVPPYYSGEVWDPSTREWTLRPELWPAEVFKGERGPRVAVVRDQLFALRGQAAVEELMHYQPSSKNWISLGTLPAHGHDGDTYSHDHKICAKGEELWVFIDEWIPCLAAKPSSVPQPPVWRVFSSFVQNAFRHYCTTYSDVLLV